MATTLNILSTVPGVQVHHADGDRLVGSRGMGVLTSENAGETWEHAASIPAPLAGRLLARCELSARLTRRGIHSIRPTDDGHWLVLAQRALHRVTPEGHCERLWGVARGKRPLRSGWCVVGGYAYVGDYYANPDRDTVQVHRVDLASGEAEPFYTFEPGQVRHVHVVQPDPYTGRLWIGTGDNDDECKVGNIALDGGDMQWVGGGSQDWRTVGLAFSQEAVVWGTDNHLGKNRIWRGERQTGTLRKLGDVVGPVYYTARSGDALLFGTSVEKGEGEQDEFARLYGVTAAQGVTELKRFRKDRWSPYWFGYGLLEFAEQAPHAPSFWVTLKGLKGGLRSVHAQLKDDANDE